MVYKSIIKSDMIMQEFEGNTEEFTTGDRITVKSKVTGGSITTDGILSDIYTSEDYIVVQKYWLPDQPIYMEIYIKNILEIKKSTTTLYKYVEQFSTEEKQAIINALQSYLHKSLAFEERDIVKCTLKKVEEEL